MNGLSIVIPAYNEEREIGKVLDALGRTLPAAAKDFEVIVVNDASSDATTQVLSRRNDINLIINPQNIGYGASLKRGIAAARFDTIAIIDADNTYPVEELPKLLSFVPDYDMIVGERRKIAYPRLNWIKQRGRNVIDLLCSYLAGTYIPDINSGMRIFKRDIALRFAGVLCDRFSFTTSLTLLMFFHDHRVRYVPIDYCLVPTDRETKVRIWRDGARTLSLILKLGFRYAPVRTAVPFVVLPLIALALWAVVR